MERRKPSLHAGRNKPNESEDESRPTLNAEQEPQGADDSPLPAKKPKHYSASLFAESKE